MSDVTTYKADYSIKWIININNQNDQWRYNDNKGQQYQNQSSVKGALLQFKMREAFI